MLGKKSGLVATFTLWSACAIQPLMAAPTASELLSKSMRHPVMAIPLTIKAPTIDGIVAEEEWSRAALFSDFLLFTEQNTNRYGTPTADRTWIFAQYTDEALYIGVRYDLPSWSPTPIIGSMQHDKAGSEDSIDIHMNPAATTDETRQTFHIGGNAGGNYYERNMRDPKVWWGWNPAIEYKARLLPTGGWEGEFKIPFKELGRKTPVPGEVWRANFVAVRKTPVGTVSGWAYWRGWVNHTQADDGWLVFTGKTLAVQFKSATKAVAQHGLEIAVVGDVAAVNVNAQVQLFKRAGNPAPEEPGLIAMFSDWLDKINVGGTDFFGMTFDQVVRKAHEVLSPVGTPIETKLAANTNKAIELHPKEEGEYLLSYRFVQDAGDKALILAAGALPFRISAPVTMAIRPLLLENGLLAVNTDLSGLSDPTQAKSIQVVVNSEPGQNVVAQSEQPVQTGRNQLEVPAKSWPAGKYVVHAKVVDKQGQMLGQAKEPYQKNELPQWWTQPEGLKPEVPEPWTPVQAKATMDSAVVNVWGRNYQFKGLPVPTSIEATAAKLSEVEPTKKPQQLLTGPIEIRAVIGGQDVVWKNDSFKLVSQKPAEAVFESVNTGSGLRLKAKTTVEFDGMIRVDLEVLSSGAPVKVEKMDMVIPFRSEVATQMCNYHKLPGPGKPVSRYIGNIGNEPLKHPVMSAQFVGTDEVGLEWFADRPKGWRLKNPDEAIEVRREADRVSEVFHFFDHEIELKEPIAITFGLIATPTKPLRKGWGQLRVDHFGLAPLPGDSVDGHPATEAHTEAWKQRAQYGSQDVNLVFSPSWSGVDWFVYPIQDPAERDKLKTKIDIAHEKGQKVLPHGGWLTIPTVIPEWERWGAEMVREPMEGTLGQGYWACYNSPWTDFEVANHAVNARMVGVDGVRFDTVIPPVECANPYHDCAWTDETGKVWPSGNIFAAREFMKRIYRVYHGGVRKDGYVYVPAGGAPINAITSFVDIYEIGEGNFMRAASLKEGYPQDQVRVRMVGSAYGLITSNNLKGETIPAPSRIAALIVAGADPRLHGGAQPNYYSRGYQLSPSGNANSVDIWDAWEWVDRSVTAYWKPYWQNSDTINVQAPPLPAGDKPLIYTSYYWNPGRKRILLVAANYEKQPVKDVKVTFDLAKLGFDKATRLYAEDAITREPVEIKDGAVTVGFFAQRYRLVKISTDLPRYREEKLGPNLLQAADFENPQGNSFTIKTNITGQAEPFAVLDNAMAHNGKASLRLQKTDNATNTGVIALPRVAMTPGQYLLSGYVHLKDDANVPEVTVLALGDGLKFDPPKEFSQWAGKFIITSDPTPGWYRFVMPFEATENTKEVALEAWIALNGNAWLDDLEVRKVLP